MNEECISVDLDNSVDPKYAESSFVSNASASLTHISPTMMTNNYKVGVTNQQQLLREKIRQKELFVAECVNVDSITTGHEVTDIACANLDTNSIGNQTRIDLTNCFGESRLPLSNLKTTGFDDESVLMLCSKESNVNPGLAMDASVNKEGNNNVSAISDGTLLCHDVSDMCSKQFCPLDLLSSDTSVCSEPPQIVKCMTSVKRLIPIHTDSLLHTPSV